MRSWRHSLHLFFGDMPTPLVWLGIAMIMASGVAASWSNGRLDGEGGG
jgi:drug/metabolite transporter (DMT)-like permease